MTAWTWLLLTAALLPSSRAAAADPGRYKVGAGYEAQAARLLGSHGAGAPLPGGWVLAGTSLAKDSIRYRFRRGGREFDFILEYPRPSHPARSRNFGWRIAAEPGALDAAEARLLPGYLGALVLKNDDGAGPWILPKDLTPSPGPGPDPVREFDRRWRDQVRMWGVRGERVQYPTLLPVRPVRLLQAVMLLSLLLAVLERRTLRFYAAKVPAPDWRWLAFWTAAGAAARLLGGVRVPGHNMGHGYELLDNLLFTTITGLDYHGDGSDALYGMALSVLPRAELSIVAVQFLCSVLAIPACYALARLWLGSRSPARWSAAFMALLPACVFFAATEERFVPGVLFMLGSLAALGLAARERRPRLWALAALLGAAACQFQHFLFLLPAAGFLFLASSGPGRQALRGRQAWLAAGLLALLSADTAAMHLRNSLRLSGPRGEVLRSVSRTIRALTPMRTDAPDGIGNAFLVSSYTPPLLVLFALAGAAGPILRRRDAGPALAALGSALLFTVPAMLSARLNMARLQLPAQPFYVLLAGSGCALLIDAARRRGGLREAVCEGAAAAGLILATAAWPGPIGASFTPQLERRAIAEGVRQVPDGCLIVAPPVDGRTPVPVPAYISGEAGRRHHWASLTDGTYPTGWVTPCQVYYRPARCYESTVRGAPDPSGLSESCARFESRLEMTPLFLRSIPARPDYVQTYSRDPLTIGFFRIGSVRD